MKKQQLAQRRNWFKYIVSGLFKPVDLEALTADEKMMWKEILTLRSELLNTFDYNSRLLGLKTPKHCWCDKIARYLNTPGYNSCKNHIGEETNE